MSDYSSISEDYIMFNNKATVDYYDDIRNYVSEDEMMKYMFSVIAEYDRCMSHGQSAKINPMSGRVSMRLENGLEFEIPENVQKVAIVSYLNMKKDGTSIEEVLPEEEIMMEEEMNFNEMQDMNGEQEKSMVTKLIEKVTRNKISSILIVILVVIIGLLIYNNFNERKSRMPSFNSPMF